MSTCSVWLDIAYCNCVCSRMTRGSQERVLFVALKDIGIASKSLEQNFTATPDRKGSTPLLLLLHSSCGAAMQQLQHCVTCDSVTHTASGHNSTIPVNRQKE